MDSITKGGVAIPRLGFGTFRMPGADARPVVESALALGYRHIDTAAMYENEAAVGEAVAGDGHGGDAGDPGVAARARSDARDRGVQLQSAMLRCALEEIGAPIASVQVEYHPSCRRNRC